MGRRRIAGPEYYGKSLNSFSCEIICLNNVIHMWRMYNNPQQNYRWSFGETDGYCKINDIQFIIRYCTLDRAPTSRYTGFFGGFLGTLFLPFGATQNNVLWYIFDGINNFMRMLLMLVLFKPMNNTHPHRLQRLCRYSITCDRFHVYSLCFPRHHCSSIVVLYIFDGNDWRRVSEMNLGGGGLHYYYNTISVNSL